MGSPGVRVTSVPGRRRCQVRGRQLSRPGRASLSLPEGLALLRAQNNMARGGSDDQGKASLFMVCELEISNWCDAVSEKWCAVTGTAWGSQQLEEASSVRKLKGILGLTACSHARLPNDRFPSAGAATVREHQPTARSLPAALPLVDRQSALDSTGVRRDWVCFVFFPVCLSVNAGPRGLPHNGGWVKYFVGR